MPEKETMERAEKDLQEGPQGPIRPGEARFPPAGQRRLKGAETVLHPSSRAAYLSTIG